MNVNEAPTTALDIASIIDLVHMAKPIILNYSLRQNITEKGEAEFDTQGVTAVQEFIQGRLEQAFPQVQFMGEEDHIHQVDPSRPVWILDPIDGTTNLIYDYHHSAVSLAYCEAGSIYAAVVYNPFTEETFSAVKGKGAYLNGKRLTVGTNATLDHCLVAIGTSPYEKDKAAANFKVYQEVFTRSLDIRRCGAASLDLTYTGCARHDAYFEANLKPWDFAAGALIVEEAGGKVTDFNGNPLDYLKNSDILASNGLIHDELVELVKPIATRRPEEATSTPTKPLSQHAQKRSAGWQEAEALGINPAFMAFLEADDYNEKYAIICEMEEILDDHLVNQMAASVDLIIEDGDIEDRVLSLKRCISTKARFESMRR